MNACAWNHDGAGAFALACADLDLKGASPEYVRKVVEQMPMLTFYADGKPCGAMVFHGDQLHIAILKDAQRRWMNKRVLREIKSALHHCGRALIAVTNETARRFAHKLGWKASGMEGGYVIYTP